MLVDVDVPRAELVRLARGLTPAKLARVVGLLDPVELMLALKKLRARRAPSNQAHVTNLKESPALLAADAAEAARRGFAEVETTVGVARYAPLNAISLLVGSQTGRPGVMTQCAVEERRNLELAFRGLVTYAETLSVYGTEPVFVDGDDTPWSKAFLGAAYASRGVKVRFTSGTGSEALMGHAQGLSMLYLEARCLAAVRAAGSQGVQNGSISCVALVLSVPGGTRAILGENVLAAWLDLEVASGNDAIASHSEIRKTAKLMGQFLPGTDFVTSGYSVMPRHDNTFGGGNFDADDIDEWLTIQRDWQVDAGIEPVGEEEVLRVRERAARAVQAVFAELGLPPVSDAEVEAATVGYDSSEMPDRDRAADVEAADDFLARGRLRARRRARARPARVRGGRGGDRLDAAPADLGRLPADGRDHRRRRPRPFGGQRPERVQRARHRLPPRRRAVASCSSHCRTSSIRASCSAARPTRSRSCSSSARRRRAADPGEVVVAVGPAFADTIRTTIADHGHREVLVAICDGHPRASARSRASFASAASPTSRSSRMPARSSPARASLSASSRRARRSSTVPTSSRSTTSSSSACRRCTRSRRIARWGENAAGYALGRRVGPVPTELDNYARAKLIVRTTLLHARETQAVRPGAAPVELELAVPVPSAELPTRWACRPAPSGSARSPG